MPLSSPPPVSIRAKVFKVALWFIIGSLALTLLLGLPADMIQRTDVDPSAQHFDSDYVFTHGSPRYFYVGDFSVPNIPAAVLIGNFAFDWACSFGFLVAVAVGMVLLDGCLRLTGFYAIGTRAPDSKKNSQSVGPSAD